MAQFFQPKKRTQVDSKHQVMHIERLDHQGAGIAYLNKKPVFVAGALPGEQALVQLMESKSRFARGKLIKVLKVSETRTKPFCPHYQECGGCDLQHLEYQAQLEYKQATLAQLMKKFSGSEIALETPICGEALAYRRRARISLLMDKKSGQLQFGFRRKQSKAIEPVTDCPVLAKPLNALLPELQQCLAGFSRQERLGHLELVLADNGPCITLRHMAPLDDNEQAALVAIAERHDGALYLMPSPDDLQRVYGEEPQYHEVGVTIPFAPNNFIQVNQRVNQQMVAMAIDWLELSADDRVLDLFCGVGNFSLPMANTAASVAGVEGVPAMVERATANAKCNQLANAQFFHANLEEEFAGQPWAAERFNKVLLDPARAGAAGIIDQISTLEAERVVYVSCNPATLARDSQSLLSQGYVLSKLTMLDMFPHTSHLESMALFVKTAEN